MKNRKKNVYFLSSKKSKIHDIVLWMLSSRTGQADRRQPSGRGSSSSAILSRGDGIPRGGRGWKSQSNPRSTVGLAAAPRAWPRAAHRPAPATRIKESPAPTPARPAPLFHTRARARARGRESLAHGCERLLRRHGSLPEETNLVWSAAASMPKLATQTLRHYYPRTCWNPREWPVSCLPSLE